MMSGSGAAIRSRGRLLYVGAAIAAICVFHGCRRQAPNEVQGYVEGEFVYVASPLAGVLDALHVQKGAQVAAGDLLFALDDAPETALRDEARYRLAQARAGLEDVRKGRRPSEIESIEAQLGQAQAALALSEKELARSRATMSQDLGRAHAGRDHGHQQVAQWDSEACPR